MGLILGSCVPTSVLLPRALENRVMNSLTRGEKQRGGRILCFWGQTAFKSDPSGESTCAPCLVVPTPPGAAGGVQTPSHTSEAVWGAGPCRPVPSPRSHRSSRRACELRVTALVPWTGRSAGAWWARGLHLGVVWPTSPLSSPGITATRTPHVLSVTPVRCPGYGAWNFLDFSELSFKAPSKRLAVPSVLLRPLPPDTPRGRGGRCAFVSLVLCT